MNQRIAELVGYKQRGEKIAMLTAYDYPTAKLLEESGVDMLLVGDSLGMVVLGYADTTLVTMDDMLHHTRAVARGATQTPILADLPFESYTTPADAVANARRLLQAGAHAVKLEGGTSQVAQILAIASEGIPVMSHIGMMPQSVRLEGGYRIKGKTEEDAQRLINDALAVEKAGAFAILLELVHPSAAQRITATVRIPTVGIGSGTDCDGQVLVIHDLIGTFPWFTPKFAKPQAHLAAQIREAAAAYIAETKA